MNVRRTLLLNSLLLGTAFTVWWSWPRPDTLIRVQSGGLAVLTDALGRDTPLPDTVFVGGRGGKRTIRVVNEDTIQHRLAMFTVPAGEETEYALPLGTFGGACSAHPTKKQLTFVIR